MINVLLTSELPWKRNCAMTFFTFPRTRLGTRSFSG